MDKNVYLLQNIKNSYEKVLTFPLPVLKIFKLLNKNIFGKWTMGNQQY